MAKKRKAGGLKPIWIEATALWYANLGPPGANGRAKRIYAPKSVDSETKAWRWLEEQLAARAARKVEAEDPTVFGLSQYWLAWSEKRANESHITRKEYVNRCTHLTLLWEAKISGALVRDLRARDFTEAELSVVVDGWRSSYSGQYIANVVRTVKACWKWGADRIAGRVPLRLLQEHTLAGYRPPAVPRRVDRYVEPAVIRSFHRWAWGLARRSPGYSKRFDRLYLWLVRFCGLTGARPGEACRLTWSMVDLTAGVVVIPAASHKTGKKTGRDREIQITRPVARMLRAVEKLEGRHPTHVFTHRRGKGAEYRGEGSAQAGEPWPDGSSASKRLLKLRRLAMTTNAVEGLVDVGPKRLIQYTGRHVYASNALMNGLTSSETAELLGNSAKMVEDVYGHVQRGHRQRLAEALVRKGDGR